MGTISDCRHLKVTLEIYLYINSSTQRCSKKIINTFLIEDFFHLPPVSTTTEVNLELQTSPRILEKFETVLVSKVHFYNNMYRTQARFISVISHGHIITFELNSYQ
jgi:hypothetical protein